MAEIVSMQILLASYCSRDQVLVPSSSFQVPSCNCKATSCNLKKYPFYFMALSKLCLLSQRNLQPRGIMYLKLSNYCACFFKGHVANTRGKLHQWSSSLETKHLKVVMPPSGCLTGWIRLVCKNPLSSLFNIDQQTLHATQHLEQE